jgi:predicted dinucleotide-binding enzyme
VLAEPVVAGVSSDMSFCGPDGEERTVVEALVADVGLRPIWVGGPDEVNTIDGVLRIWLALVMKRHHSRHGCRRATRIIESLKHADEAIKPMARKH